MGDIAFLRLTFTGGHKTSELASEEWQFGINWMPTLGSPMADIHAVTGDFDAAYDVATGSGTGFVSERNFILEGGATDIDPMDWLENECAPAIQTFMNTTGLFHSDNYIKTIEVWPIGFDGKVVQLPAGAAKASLSTTVNTWDGQSSINSLAPFTTFAMSTVTVANIPRGRGRFYPPPFTTSLLTAATGLLTSSGRTVAAGAGTTLLEDCALEVGLGDAYLRPCVIGDPWTTAYAITGIRVGDVPDTQRRRKKSITETFTLDNCSF